MNEAITLLDKIGFEKEHGLSNNGFYKSAEVVSMMESYGVTQALMPTLKVLAEHGSPTTMGHEAIHCFDVADGSAELAKVMDEAGISTESYFPHDPVTAFMAGVFHDIILGFRQESLETAIPREMVAALVTPEESARWGDVVYLKGPIADDILGAALLDVCELGDRADLKKAVISAATGPELAVPYTNAPLIQKVLDGIWFHDGNYPTRGCGEVEMILGQRLPLYREGKLSAEIMEQGIGKVLGYMEVPDGWEKRSRTTDIAYLEKKLNKKAPGFLDAVKGTRVYDFIVEDIVPRGRSFRALNSPAFWRGVDASASIIQDLIQEESLMKKYGQKIKQLEQVYKATVQTYR